MIESVAAQTINNWELILVDGTSDDATAEVVEGYAAKLGERIRFERQPNQGCNVARNAGIQMARGEFIAFLDSDDEYLPNKLERQLDFLHRRQDVGLVFSDYRVIDHDRRRHASAFVYNAPLALKVPFEEAGTGFRVCAPDLFDYLVQQYFIATITGVVRRSVLGESIRFHEQNRYGFVEWLFFLEIALRTRVGYVNEPLCVNHFVPGSITRTSRLRNSVAHRMLIETMLDRFGSRSSHARIVLRREHARTCRQLGFDSMRAGEYAAAAAYLRRALRSQFAWRTCLQWAQSMFWAAATLNRCGREPMLRPGAAGSGD